MDALATTPAAIPPPGQTTNFINPVSQQGMMIAVCTVIMALTLCVVTVRLYSTVRVTRTAGYEDYICIISMLFSFIYIAFVLDLSFAARHMWDVPVIWFTENYWKIRFAQNTFQALAFFTSRMPILLLYLRLFGTNVGLRYAVYFGIVAAFCIYITEIPLISYFCTPRIGGSWNSLSVFTKCKRLVIWAVVQGSCDIAMDLYIFMLPIPSILALQMPLRKKIGIFAIFGVGLFAVIASAVSLYYRYELSYGADVNWNEGAYIATAAVEINIALICSSIPACASLFNHLFKDQSFITSLRSLFRIESKHSTSYNSSYRSKASQGGRYGENNTPLQENGYLELQDVKLQV